MNLGNLGNLLLIIIPAICDEDGSPFGDRDTCTSLGLSYASFSMAVNILYSFNMVLEQQGMVSLIFICLKISAKLSARWVLPVDLYLSACENLVHAIAST